MGTTKGFICPICGFNNYQLVNGDEERIDCMFCDGVFNTANRPLVKPH